MNADQFKSEMIDLLPRLRRFAISLARTGPDADDLLQDACSTALLKWGQYDSSQPLDRWMFRIIRNHWISEIRKRKVREGEGQVPAEDETIELSVQSTVVEKLAAQQICQKVSSLGADLSQPLLLVCAEGFSYKEAAEMLDVPIGTVMSRIHRARKLLLTEINVQENLQ
ncbi:RNA polymerase sigma factor [Octadecabacter sp. CECT 8868]|uniref:RNA polymerase sigma factor n=1 Tax=Octadecabacter algicola TaxID=2909342 RepID=UPI001F413234|nr:RNA polymerase sigma factor [Octadecabacter algicola]MCF2905923.1 RNA polymerase sigma factor [Octadecabacter algicola]